MASLVDLLVPPELDKPVTLVVDIGGEEGEESVEVVVTGESGERVDDSSIKISKAEKHTIEFTPPSPAQYTVSVRQAGNDVLDPPLKLNLSRPDAKSVLLTQPPTGKIRAGQAIDILFDTFPSGRGQLEASCVGEMAGDIPVRVERQGLTTIHKVTFLPTQEDEYSLSVTYSGKSIKGSPFKIDLIPVNPDKVQCSEVVLPEDKPGCPGAVEMDVCTEGAGKSHLRAKCEGEECGQVTVDVTETSKNNYHLKFEPPRRDKFTLAVLYGGKSIKNSPFVVDLSSKIEKVKVGELHVPETTGADEEVWLEVDCSEASNEELKACCKGRNDEGEIPVIIEEIEPRKHRVAFSPKLPDIYDLTLFFGDRPLPEGGSFEINLLPKSDSKLVRHLGTFVPDDCKEPVVLTFDATKAGEGAMRARANGVLQAGPVAVEVQQVDGEYRVSFVPDGADTYNVDVYWSDETIPGSPIYVKIVYPSEVLVSDPLTDPPPELLRPVRVDVDTQYAGPGVLSVKCSGRETGEIDVEVIQSETDNTKYAVSFRPIEPDFYTLRVFFNDEEVKYSPKEVDIRPLEPPKPPTPVPSPEEEVDHPTELEMTLGQPLTLSVDSVEEAGGDSSGLTAVASGREVGVVPVTITRRPEEGEEGGVEEGGPFQVVFDPTIPDLYTVDVKLGGRHVPSSPFLVNYLAKKEDTPPPSSPTPPPPSPPQEKVLEETTIEIEPLAESVLRPRTPDVVPTHPITKPYLIRYVPEEQGERNSGGLDRIEAYAIHDDSCTRQVLKIRWEASGHTFLVLRAEKAGLHYIHIKEGGKEIRGSPFKLEIVASNPTSCRVEDIPERVYVGERGVIKIDASEAGAGDMHVIATVPQGGKDTVFSHTETSPGKFDIKFVPTMPGKHSLTIKWSEVPIPGSPLNINVLPLTEEVRQAQDAASRVSVYDERGVFGSKLQHKEGAIFLINTEKAGRGELKVKARGPGNARIDITRHRGALYKCRVFPVVSGWYELKILWNDLLISGHPYRLDFTADKSYIINGLDLDSERFVVGRDKVFKVDCSQQLKQWRRERGKRGEGELEVFTTPSDCAEVEVTSGEGGIRVVRIQPKLAGNHEVSLKFGGRHLLHSPYHVQFESETRSGSHDDDTDGRGGAEGEREEQREEEEGGDRLLRLSGIDFPISLEDTPTTKPSTAPDEFLSPPLPSSLPATTEPPVPANQEPPEPVEVRAFGPGLNGGIIGQEGNFTIVTDGAGRGKLEVGIRGARGTFKTRLRRHPDSERTVLARYDPTNIGEYTIDVLWGEKHVQGSPFLVDIKSQERELEAVS